MNAKFACALAAAALSMAVAANAQSVTTSEWSVQQRQQFETWLKAERAWREWMDDHRNAVSRNWMGMDSRNWLGMSASRKPRPVPPAWLETYCGSLTPEALDDHVSCQQYEQLKTYDWAVEAVRYALARERPEKVEHSHFNLKRHWGFGFGYDNRMAHGSMGMQLTIAEWGRWNYGTLGASLGFTRRSVVDRNDQTVTKNDVALFLTMASASYRIKYVPSLGMYWYVDFAQVYDMNHSMAGSQFGFSLARK